MTGHASSSTDWDASGLIPPFDPEHPTHPNRSPYRKSLSDFVVEFGLSKLRRDLLASLLDFRDALHQAQLTRGFQWINGSFAEHVEVRQDRDPKDIDVVTFFTSQMITIHREICSMPILHCLSPNGVLLAQFTRIFTS